MTDKFQQPNQVTHMDIIAGPEKISDFLPEMQDIPNEFFLRNNEKAELISTWFFNGLTQEIVKTMIPKPGIDKSMALGHIKCVLMSMQPKHERKIAGCAYLLSKWFN